MRSLRLAMLFLGACAGEPDAVLIELSPSLISSLDGTTTVTALVAVDTTPLADVSVRASVEYTDRNGTVHAIDAIDGVTDERGVFETRLSGLIWDGIGTVTVETASGVSGSASFSVLDRTPPTIEILPPTTDLTVGPGLPLDVQVRVTDEIGISEVILDGNGTLNNGSRRTVIASGQQDTTLTFRTSVDANAASGPSVRLYALAVDLSGNIAVADSLTLTVDPAITIATPPGLSGSLLADGTAARLVNPRAIAYSTKDSHLYVADDAGVTGCDPGCVWRVDPATGTIDSTPVFVAQNTIEGVAFDADSDNLYISDRANRIVRLAWNGSNAYTTLTECVDTGAQQPASPFHLAIDTQTTSLGIVVTDDQDNNLQHVTTCGPTAQGQAISAQDSFDDPRGVAIGPAGELYVSDINTDRVSRVDRGNGSVSAFTGDVDRPYGVEWLAGTHPEFSSSLMIASMGQRTVLSAKSSGIRAATYLRNVPIDLTIDAGTMYILTVPSANNRGRIYKVTGF